MLNLSKHSLRRFLLQALACCATEINNLVGRRQNLRLTSIDFRRIHLTGLILILNKKIIKLNIYKYCRCLTLVECLASQTNKSLHWLKHLLSTPHEPWHHYLRNFLFGCFLSWWIELMKIAFMSGRIFIHNRIRKVF